MMYGRFIHHAGVFGPWWLHLLVSGLVWAALIGLGIFLITRLTRQPRVAPAVAQSPLTAMEVLRQRYARGEIDADTFARMRQDLINTGANDLPPTQL